MTRGQIRPGVNDGDDGLAVPVFTVQTHLPRAGAVAHRSQIVSRKTAGRVQIFGLFLQYLCFPSIVQRAAIRAGCLVCEPMPQVAIFGRIPHLATDCKKLLT